MTATINRHALVGALAVLLCAPPAGAQQADDLPADPTDADVTAANNRGFALYKQRRHAEAVVEFKKALKLCIRVHGDQHTDTALILLNLAIQHQELEQHDQAEPWLLRALEIQEARLGKDSPWVAKTLDALGVAYHGMSRYAQGEPLLLRALSIRQARRDHAGAAEVQVNLVCLYRDWGRYAQAEKLARNVVADREAQASGNLRALGPALRLLGSVLSRKGDYEEAQAVLLRGLELNERHLGRDHGETLRCVEELAKLYERMGRLAQALPLYRRWAASCQAVFGPSSPKTGQALQNLADLYTLMRQYAQAEPLYLQALAIAEKLAPHQPGAYAACAQAAAGMYESDQRYDQAERLYLRAIQHAEKLDKTRSAALASILNDLALLYHATGRYSQAEPLYLRALKLDESWTGQDDATGGPTMRRHNLARLYQAMGRRDKSAPLLQGVLETWKKNMGPTHPKVGECMNSLAHVYLGMGELEKAWDLARQAQPILLARRAMAADAPLDRAVFHGAHGSGCKLLEELTLRLNKPVDVLELVESSQALALRELLALGQVQAGQGAAAAEAGQSISSQRMAVSPVLDAQTAVLGWVQHDERLWGYVIRSRGKPVWVNLSGGFDSDADGLRIVRTRAAGRDPRPPAASPGPGRPLPQPLPAAGRPPQGRAEPDRPVAGGDGRRAGRDAAAAPGGRGHAHRRLALAGPGVSRQLRAVVHGAGHPLPAPPGATGQAVEPHVAGLGRPALQPGAVGGHTERAGRAARSAPAGRAGSGRPGPGAARRGDQHLATPARHARRGEDDRLAARA